MTIDDRLGRFPRKRTVNYTFWPRHRTVVDSSTRSRAEDSSELVVVIGLGLAVLVTRVFDAKTTADCSLAYQSSSAVWRELEDLQN